jgi:hypothetical protein
MLIKNIVGTYFFSIWNRRVSYEIYFRKHSRNHDRVWYWAMCPVMVSFHLLRGLVKLIFLLGLHAISTMLYDKKINIHTTFLLNYCFAVPG